MQVKKYLAVFSLMMIMFLSVLPSFASANSYANAVSVGEDLILVQDKAYGTKVAINDKYASLNPSDGFVVDLGKSTDLNSIKMNSFNNVRYVGAEIRFFNSEGKMILGYDLAQLKYFDAEFQRLPNTVKDVRYVKFTYEPLSGNGLLFYEFVVSEVPKGKTGTFPPKGSNAVLPNNTTLDNEIENLNVVEGVNDVTFTWKNPSVSEFSGVKIFNGDLLVATLKKDDTSYKVIGLEANTNYNFKFVSMYGDRMSHGIQKGVKTLIDPKRIPPSPVSSLTAEPTDNTVKLKWKSPKDDDLAGFKILQNGKQIAEIGLEEEFTVKNLQPLTDYNFGVIAVDRDKNDSSPVNLSVKTLEENDEEPPHVPSNVFAKPSNGALIASWDKVSDKDLAGYNVYLDGKKINSNLISSTNFTIKNLENNRKYKVQVQAVDRSGNASELSLSAFGTPDTNTIPIIESKYSLEDVSDGVGVMFSQLWLVLAFAVGIPLAFYIIYKLKHTVLP
ncbi:fibronectin type III domain-containing protein [Bacillus thuringiensis]|uniref:fibronectin type III domain-containing protein n=1 Tax=Bacillus thuringiensis TaxID=1428 RepID=UPI00367145C4